MGSCQGKGGGLPESPHGEDQGVGEGEVNGTRSV